MSILHKIDAVITNVMRITENVKVLSEVLDPVQDS